MEVRFKDDPLRRCFQYQKDGRKRWGEKVARLYVRRVNELRAVESAHVLGTMPQLHFHPLKGGRAGQYAIWIDEFWRLIVSFDDQSMRKVCIEEVSKHYD